MFGFLNPFTLYVGLAVLNQESLEDYTCMTALRISIIVIFLPTTLFFLLLKSVMTYDNQALFSVESDTTSF